MVNRACTATDRGALAAHAGPVAALLLLLAGCAAPPPFQREMPPPAAPVPRSTAAGTAIARAAQSLIGSPYRYGGAGPDAFDCSGLVTYVHRQFGLSTPRTAAQQYASARPIPRADLQAGDLVFFRLNGAVVSHVGVYMGNGRFVHAPQSGGLVREAGLDDEFFRNRFAGGGRFYPPGVQAVPAAMD
jgi:cell wall-associated NlpC family hydrolase